MINIGKELADVPRDFSGRAGDPGRPEIAMLLQVHDELVFEVKTGRTEHYAKKLKPLMENAIKLSVPVGVEAKAGKNWGEMTKFKV
jgi:DNA polymerase I-like protein with 3'-5' exonuclease and polymerase domains